MQTLQAAAKQLAFCWLSWCSILHQKNLNLFPTVGGNQNKDARRDLTKGTLTLNTSISRKKASGSGKRRLFVTLNVYTVVDTEISTVYITWFDESSEAQRRLGEHLNFCYPQ